MNMIGIEGFYFWQGRILETLTGSGVLVFGGVVVLIFIGSLMSERIRARHMEAFARELHCRFTRRRPGRRVPDENERNIIEGVWRGQPILIYDLHIQEGEDTSRRTVVNGKYYMGEFLTYLPIKKIRRVLAGDPVMIEKAMPDAALPSLIPGYNERGFRAAVPYIFRMLGISIAVIVIVTFILYLIISSNLYAKLK